MQTKFQWIKKAASKSLLLKGGLKLCFFRKFEKYFKNFKDIFLGERPVSMWIAPTPSNPTATQPCTHCNHYCLLYNNTVLYSIDQ